MKITKKEKVEEFKKFIEDLSGDDKIVILYDTDTNGYSAGVLAKKGLEKLGKKVSQVIARDDDRNEMIKKFLKQVDQEINTIIAVDIPLESDQNITLLKNYKILVLDHHQIYQKIEDNIIVIKPDMIQDKLPQHQISAGQVVYYMFNEITDMKEFEWIALNAAAGDCVYNYDEELIKNVLGEIPKNIYTTTIGQLSNYYYFGKSEGIEKEDKILFNALDKSKNPEEALNKLAKYKNIEEVFNELMKKFEDEKETTKDIIIFKQEETKHLNSLLSTQASLKYTNKTILFITRHGDYYNISARRRDEKVNMGYLMKECTKDLPEANGGGHAPAAGGRIRAEDYERFKKKLIQLHEKHRVE